MWLEASFTSFMTVKAEKCGKSAHDDDGGCATVLFGGDVDNELEVGAIVELVVVDGCCRPKT